MSECSIYQLLLQTDYVRLREKYDHLYIYSHILSYIRESSQLIFFKQKILVPSSKHSTGQEFSHLTVETHRVCVNHCFAGSDCLTTAVRTLDGTRIFCLYLTIYIHGVRSYNLLFCLLSVLNIFVQVIYSTCF
jgi:hypothetical protein